MTSPRTFQVQALSRVEGEGALYVKLEGDRVQHVELNIYEPPRFFESFLRGREIHEVPDITARICGICPVAYQMSACHALEKALGIQLTPEIHTLRRLLYCGEWIESHTLHMHLLHAPDFLGYESGISMAADHKEVVQRGLRLKKIGNRVVETLGGRAIHPINVTVGGFYRAPRRRELQALAADLDWGLQAAIQTLHLVASFDFPDFEQDYQSVSLHHPDQYPMNQGQVVSSSGLAIPAEEYEQHFQERQVKHSTALHSVLLPEEINYLVGPLARINNCFDQLSPTAKREAERCKIEWPLRNNFKSIVARALEVIHAYEEAVQIVKTYHGQPSACRVPFQPREGSGCHATEAPRGLLYHRYRIGDDGLIQEAKIVPPTSQNQGQIEEDLRNFVPQVTQLDDDQATRKCEHMIRNYDPCISCSTHFLELTIER
ncbi:MAG: Ni/Fe hydrogenase subunit alpha [Planctomycetales bacterium]|nr:Ni/Fe hydrogenase subunit alpha [Planctomycetales bacterium]NIM10193.1 Ni/Fe hydrogenase subunit alpha [Planctomycetales bacterium]NIN09616.1 Ni/Fe hydrogenase subunit alpha [Planctomycetales bacterium]NIN78742.1 Ni/Fe hydrogenase subunit alpha [Planctomycetales bacterium]NIO35916.1 Ni/Fe hydrogenase subunit alpha [Planctomycetales bacterium]